MADNDHPRVIEWLFELFTSPNVAEAPQEEASSQEKVFSDRPIRSAEEDHYGYSESVIPRLLRVTLKWPSRDGLIIGLYGQWGIGKTSILNLYRRRIKAEPERYSGVRVVRFSPWHYDDPGALFTSFFSTVSAAFESDPGQEWAAMAESLRKVGRFLAIASKGLTVFGVNVDAEKILNAAQATGETASLFAQGEIGLQEHWDTIENALTKLAHEGGRLVVLIDDADRLRQGEILRLLRLLRTVGDLPGISIVVAMDDQRVRRLLRQGDGLSPGERYLEKIVQVGIQIPQPSPEVLQDQLLKQLQALFEESELPSPTEFTPESFQLSKTSLDLVATLIVTPRELQRYLNSLRILVLGAGSSDVHPVDAVLIEAIHVFFPPLYGEIRSRRRFFTQTQSRLEQFGLNQSEIEEERRQIFDGLMTRGTKDADKPRSPDTARSIVIRLFGENLLRSATRSHPPEEAATRRIRHPDYFDRYFLRPPPRSELSIREVEDLVSQLEEMGESNDESSPADALHETLITLSGDERDSLMRDLGVVLDQLNYGALQSIVIDVLRSEAWDTDPKRRFTFQALCAKAPRGITSEAVMERLTDFTESILLEAVSVLPIYQGASLLFDSDAYWLSDEIKESVTGQWLERFITRVRGVDDVFEDYSIDELFNLLRFAHKQIRRLENPPFSSEEVLVVMRDQLRDNPHRLPEFLQQRAITSGSQVYLTSEMIRGPREALEDFEELFGSRTEIEDAITAYREHEKDGDDPHQLVPELKELLDEDSSDEGGGPDTE